MLFRRVGIAGNHFVFSATLRCGAVSAFGALLPPGRSFDLQTTGQRKATCKRQSHEGSAFHFVFPFLARCLRAIPEPEIRASTKRSADPRIYSSLSLTPSDLSRDWPSETAATEFTQIINSPASVSVKCAASASMIRKTLLCFMPIKTAACAIGNIGSPHSGHAVCVTDDGW